MSHETRHLLALTRARCKEHERQRAIVGYNDRFDCFLLTYSRSTGHLDANFFRSGTSTPPCESSLPMLILVVAAFVVPVRPS